MRGQLSFFQDVTCSSVQCLRAELWGWLPGNTRLANYSNKTSCLSLRNAGSQNILEGESLQNRVVASTPITFLIENKYSYGFLSCDTFSADPGMLPVALLCARELCWPSGNHFILSWALVYQLSVAPVSLWGCLLWFAGVSTAVVSILFLSGLPCAWIWDSG